MRPFLFASLALAAAAPLSLAQIATPSILCSNDPTSPLPPVYLYDPIGNSFGGTITSGMRHTGFAYDQAARRVYMLTRGTPSTPSATQSVLHTLDVNPLSGPTFVNNVSGASVNITSGGLAWDNVNGRLIVSFGSRIYTLDTASAFLTEIRSFGSGPALNGADIDPVSGALYLVNSTTGSGGAFTARGIYRLDLPYETSNPVRIANFPIRDGANQEDSIYGAAVGMNTVFLTTQESFNLYRLSLTDFTYQPNTLTPFAGTGMLGGGATFVATDQSGADVGVSIRVATNSIVSPTGQTPFLVHVRNVGSASASDVAVSIPLPGGATFVSATNGAAFGGGFVTFNPGTLAAGAGDSFLVTFSAASSYTATASVTTSTTDIFSGNNSASALSTGPAAGPDLLVTLTAPANCSITAGNPGTFVVNVVNRGSRAAATTLSFPIPAGSMFVSSTPTGIPSGGFVGIDMGVIEAGATASASIDMIPGEGAAFGITATATITAGGPDANPADNTASGSTTTGIFSSAPIRALLSTISSNTNSTFTGLGGDTLNGAGTLDCTRSSNGRYITSHIRVGPSGNFNDLLIRTDTLTNTSSVIGREGVTVAPGSGNPIAFDTLLTPGVNDSGDFAFAARDSSAAATDSFAVVNIGGSFTEVAREGSAIPALSGPTYGNAAGTGAISSGGITNAGTTYFVATINGNPAGQDEGAFANNGSTLVYARGSTPIGAAGPLTDILNTGYYLSADGVNYLFQASSTAGGSKTYAVYGTVASGGADATALVATGQVLPGFTSAIQNFPTQATVMTPEGRWLLRGSNADGEDWVLAGTGSTVSAANIIARSGPIGTPAPITPGNTETWDPGASTTSNFTAAAANANGDYVVYGKTLGDARTDLVWVFNGTTVIAREGDPVDANNDGLFNDGMYIRQLNFDDQMVLTNDALYAVVGLRDSTATTTGICGAGSSSAALALVRIPIPQPNTVVCCRGSTCAVVATGTCTDPAGAAGAVSPAAAICNSGSFTTPCCYGDYNKVGGISVGDIFDFLNDWFLGSTYTRVGTDGGPGPITVQNIFDFLNIWFAGGC